VNYYKKIQKSIDFIDENLTNTISINKLAGISCFSPAQFYRIFFALTGFFIKNYIREALAKGMNTFFLLPPYAT